MAQKVLFETALADLRTTDVEGLGSLRFDEFGNVYKWVKNSGSTALVAAGSCLQRITSVVGSVGKRVIAPDGAGASTGLVNLPSGVPMTAIAASGAGTGDHGWIMIEGVKKVSIFQMATAVTPGFMAIATSAGGWDKPYTSTIDSTNGGTFNVRHVCVAQAIATTGVATATSAICFIRCMK